MNRLRTFECKLQNIIDLELRKTVGKASQGMHSLNKLHSILKFERSRNKE